VVNPSPLPPFRRRLVLFLLGLSLAGNITALLVPFMNLRIAFTTEPYSLLSSATMMWNKGLYVLAALVIAFSVVFPFAKLATLIWVASATALGPALALVERLGKWSMIDVFLVCPKATTS